MKINRMPSSFFLGAKRRSNPRIAGRSSDCFASLAMTAAPAVRLFFRHTGLLQAVDDALPSSKVGRMVAQGSGANSGNRASRVDCKPCPTLGARFIEPPNTGQSSRQIEMRHWIICIGFDGPAQPSYRLLLLAMMKIGHPRYCTPVIGKGVVGTVPIRLTQTPTTCRVRPFAGYSSAKVGDSAPPAIPRSERKALKG